MHIPIEWMTSTAEVKNLFRWSAKSIDICRKKVRVAEAVLDGIDGGYEARGGKTACLSKGTKRNRRRSVGLGFGDGEADQK